MEEGISMITGASVAYFERLQEASPDSAQVRPALNASPRAASRARTSPSARTLISRGRSEVEPHRWRIAMSVITNTLRDDKRRRSTTPTVRQTVSRSFGG
jgi:hypothetical protein